MTNPGLPAQQADQQAVQQNLRDSTERRAAETGQPPPQYYAYRRSPVRTGPGLVSRLIGLVAALVGIAVAIGILLLALNRTNPYAVHHIGQWLGHLF